MRLIFDYPASQVQVEISAPCGFPDLTITIVTTIM